MILKRQKGDNGEAGRVAVKKVWTIKALAAADGDGAEGRAVIVTCHSVLSHRCHIQKKMLQFLVQDHRRAAIDFTVTGENVVLR